MRLRQLVRILSPMFTVRAKDHVRIVVNGVAFPIRQKISVSRHGVTYLFADTTPEKGDPEWKEPK